MRKKFFPVLLAGTLLLLMAAVPGMVNADHAWGNYHWARSSNPVSLELGDNVSSTWDSHLALATADWDKSTVLALTVAGGAAKGRCQPTEGRIEVCNDFYGSNGWLGLAQIWVSGEHIAQATTKVNDTYFSAPPYNTSEWRQMVMCQEVGHDFGLDHQDENFDNANLGTCMDYTSDPSTNQHPNRHDYDELEIIYSHLDGGSGGGGGGNGNCPPKGNKPGCNGNGIFGPGSGELHSQREWGQLVRAEGRTAVFERDFGGGNRVFTFVIWAD
jgi:hypothetical protein